ncbi:molybdopterin oxidoreductase [Thermodesulfatator indicus DSM 15286]|uniref:Molybdopterin oxidoreductase n=1 Tax=Thermodesulfatator indicus (strain DSM 15286 / JCM 11887 / CIR29812) TaxID=667014 RepID=F8AAW8_THEID|nr:molybdopterin-dependent oxidoreductase [Thermodesulfatator indicus]AEH45482.1 molybdopterin oxidoreductase [Thermodesulfatator indicus DSM 15286]
MGEKRTVYSICGMCSVRCPIAVEVEDNEVLWISGNPHDQGIKTGICAKGIAGRTLLKDTERPLSPLIREGERGSGKWRSVSWDEALDYVADKLKKIIDEYGGRAVLLSDRGGPFGEYRKAFLKAIGSPNYCNHDVTCAMSVNHAALSLFGFGRKTLNYDYKNAKHIILYGRNIMEAIKIKTTKAVLDALDKGAKLTYIDPRYSVTASKATRWWKIWPGTDYALNLALIHILIKESLYDKEFVSRWLDGFEHLANFVEPYTPEWAEKETGIPAHEMYEFCREVAQDAPHVIFHPGWMRARYLQAFWEIRTTYLLNILLGAIEVPGGLFFMKGPGDAGKKGLNSIGENLPKVEEKRADGVGWKYPHINKGPGLLHRAFEAIKTGDPYPLKAYFVHRHDPLTGLPDPEAQVEIFKNLDLLVVIDVNWSETSKYADVILPECTYLERSDLIATQKGLKPGFRIRTAAIKPQYDTKPGWWIYLQLAKRLGKGEHFPYETIEDLWQKQLEGTGVSVEDIQKKGFISLTDKPIWYDREEKLPFKTASGKIEIIAKKWEEAGIPSLKPYESPEKPPAGKFRLLFGRCAWQTHGMWQNNPALHPYLKENVLWINDQVAKEMGLKTGDTVIVRNGNYEKKIKIFATELIHPEAVYMLHGFGRTVPQQTRAYQKGVADQRLEIGLLDVYDPAGGANALCECFIEVEPVK